MAIHLHLDLARVLLGDGTVSVSLSVHASKIYQGDEHDFSKVSALGIAARWWFQQRTECLVVSICYEQAVKVEARRNDQKRCIYG